jgi:hypothetical protein
MMFITRGFLQQAHKDEELKGQLAAGCFLRIQLFDFSKLTYSLLAEGPV